MGGAGGGSAGTTPWRAFSQRGAGLGGSTGSSSGTDIGEREGVRNLATPEEALRGPTAERGGTLAERGSSGRRTGLSVSGEAPRGPTPGGWRGKGAQTGGPGPRWLGVRAGHTGTVSYLRAIRQPPRSTEAGRRSARTPPRPFRSK